MSEQLKEDWLRIKRNDSAVTDLRCLKDSKGRVVKVSDYNGHELKHNADAFQVHYLGKFWSY